VNKAVRSTAGPAALHKARRNTAVLEERILHELQMVARTSSIPLQPTRASGFAVDDFGHRDEIAGVYFLKSSNHLDVFR